MGNKQTILLKLTGTALLNKEKTGPDATLIRSLARQIKSLANDYWFGIVIGGGNFFRGSQQGKILGLVPATAHQVGMLATALNGLIVQDILQQEGIATLLLSAFSCPAIAESICPEKITKARSRSEIIIFIGGTGNPFFTTDTAAVVRALQINADQLWKATTVAGVYDSDPRINTQARKLQKVLFAQAIENNLGIMDKTAFALAQEHDLPIRVFDITTDNALMRCAQDKSFGSLITN